MATIGERHVPPVRHAAWEFEGIVYYGLLALVLLVVLVPLALLVITSFQALDPAPGAEWSLAGWRSAVEVAFHGDVLWNTFAITLVRTGISLPIAVVIAWLLARTDLPCRSGLLFMFWIAFFLPTLPVIQGWVLILDPDFGLLNRAIETLPFVEDSNLDIFSWWGIIFGHLVTGTVAVKVILLTPIFRNMDSTLEEAARSCSASPLEALVRIVIPLMKPAILLVALIAAIRALESFEVELFLGVPRGIDVYSTAIYRMLNREPALYGTATAMSIMILVLMVPLIVLHRWATTRRRYDTLTGRSASHPMKLGRWRRPLFALLTTIVCGLTVLPVIFLIVGSFMRIFGWFEISETWTTDHWAMIFRDTVFLNAARNTVFLGFGAAGIGIVLYVLIAYVSLRTRFWARSIIDFVSWVPLALPGVILGLGMLLLFLEVAPLRIFYGSLLPLIIVVTLGGMTTGVQLIKASMANLGYEIEESAWSAGGTRLMALRQIVLPLLMPVLLTVSVLTFATAVRNVSYVALLSAGETQPLSMLQLQYAVDGNYEAGAAVGLVIVAITVGVAFAAHSLSMRIGSG